MISIQAVSLHIFLIRLLQYLRAVVYPQHPWMPAYKAQDIDFGSNCQQIPLFYDKEKNSTVLILKLN